MVEMINHSLKTPYAITVLSNVLNVSPLLLYGTPLQYNLFQPKCQTLLIWYRMTCQNIGWLVNNMWLMIS